MNQYPGVIGRKLGMTQIFAEDGSVVPCTVVEASAIVIGKRTQEKDGYDALIVGTGERKDKHTSKAVAGQFKKANVPGRRTLREFRCSAEYAQARKGAEPRSIRFEEGQSSTCRGSRGSVPRRRERPTSPGTSDARYPRVPCHGGSTARA